MDHLRFRELSYRAMLALECIRRHGSKSQTNKCKALLLPFSDLVGILDEAKYENVEMTEEYIAVVENALDVLLSVLPHTKTFITPTMIASAKIYIDEQFVSVDKFLENITRTAQPDDPCCA